MVTQTNFYLSCRPWLHQLFLHMYWSRVLKLYINEPRFIVADRSHDHTKCTVFLCCRALITCSLHFNCPRDIMQKWTAFSCREPITWSYKTYSFRRVKYATLIKWSYETNSFLGCRALIKYSWSLNYPRRTCLLHLIDKHFTCNKITRTAGRDSSVM